MIVVFLVEDEASVRSKGEQALGGFNVLYFRVVQLPRELPLLQDCRGGDEEQQHQSKYAHVPKRQTMTDVGKSQHLRFVFPENEADSAHRVQ